ncbi:MAG: glycosyltransferase family 4 protein [Candidatus Omnitrophica bacterium]|nr:glycosyltransferase family 4 protein [Candidatus Omnitrophota bacterium]
MKIALISTGLGHIKRGIETWTYDLGKVLVAKGIDLTVYKGGGQPEFPYEKVIGCWKRDNPLSRWLIKNRPGFLWRLGMGTGYTWEQTTFNWNILPELLIKQYDIIHTQDPQVAEFFQRVNRLGILKSKVILAHGTEESFDFLGQFDYLQHLAPYHKEETESHGYKGKQWFAIGNFVDTDLFHPDLKPDLRAELGIPAEAFVVLSVAAIKKTHKRIDYLIDEVHRLNHDNVYLVVAGSQGEETPPLLKMGKERLGAKVVFLSDFPHERIQEVYAMADIFALCSLKDMMPIALLEALSSGLPAVVHQYPVEAWMVGEGGDVIDMSEEGKLAQTITKYLDESYKKDKSQKARAHAEKNFAKDVIMKQIYKMYELVARC